MKTKKVRQVKHLIDFMLAKYISHTSDIERRIINIANLVIKICLHFRHNFNKFFFIYRDAKYYSNL